MAVKPTAELPFDRFPAEAGAVHSDGLAAAFFDSLADAAAGAVFGVDASWCFRDDLQAVVAADAVYWSGTPVMMEPVAV